MRTLKKVLALTIALATLFSLTAFAAYKDESAIASGTMSAVNLVNSLKIMTGDGKGNFNPTATITRAEAAKMVYVVLTGGKENADGWKGQNVFTDVKYHWAEGFINYCASMGILAGVGNGKYNPDGTLTGVELAKMLLVAAGYKADVQGYTGSAWQSKVLADAETAGLFLGYAPMYTGAAPRQYAAVMFNNCLLNTMTATYIGGQLITSGALGSQLVGAKYFGLAKVEGLPTSFGATSLSVGGKSFNNANVNMDLRGQDIVVVYNNRTNEVYNMYASGKSKVYNVNASDIDLTINATTKNATLEFTGYDETVYAASVANTTPAAIKLFSTSAKVYTANASLADLKAALPSQTNHQVRFIDETGDDVIDTAIVFDAQYDTVASNVPADGEFELDNVSGYDTDAVKDYNKLVFVDTVAKGDVVKLVTNLAGQKTIAKVEPVKGVLTAKTSSENTFGGTKYKESAQKVVGFVLAGLSLGTEYNVYTDGKYVVKATVAGEEVVPELSANIALVLAKQAGMDDGFTVTANKVQVLLSTGETKVFEWGGSNTDFGALTVNTVQQYTLKDGKITMQAVVDPDGSGTKFDTNKPVTFNYATSGSKFSLGTEAVRVASNAYFFMQKDGAPTKYVVVKASELNADYTATAGTGFAYTTQNGIKTIQFGFLDTAGPAVQDDKVFAIVSDNTVIQKWDSAKSEVYYVVAATNMKGEQVEFRVATASTTVTKGINDVVTSASTGVSTLTAKTADYNALHYGATMTGFDASSIVVGGNFINFADGMTTIYIESTTDFTVKSSGKLADAVDLAGGVHYITNSAGKITTLIVALS